ncbi:MAG: hypothetical protein K940chlam3_00026 [Chlamydiae bacterium]|nr:hypothetical protein [Chlamydiota bacterium]
MELNAKAFGLAGGILWGVSMFIMTWLSLWTGYGALFLDAMMGIYPGFEISPVGSFIGLAYGFIDGVVGLFILGWLYNRFRF